MKKQIPGILVLILLSYSVYAQEGGSQTTQGSVGSVTIDGKLWNQIALRPVIPIGKFGVALDLVLYIDGEGNIHKDEWDFSSLGATKNTIIDKIYYIRYGFPGNPLYFRVGALDYVFLGYGILVSGYSNTMQYPQVRKVGLDLRLKKWNHSFEGFINDFKENIGLLGMRVSRPLPGGFKGGITIVTDRNQYLGLKDRDDDGVPDVLDDFPRNSSIWADTDGDRIEDSVDPDADGDNILEGGRDDNGDGIIDGTETIDLGGDDTLGIPYDAEIVLKKFSRLKNGDPITGVAFDLSYPLLNQKKLRVDIYVQAAQLIGKTVNPETGEKIATGMGLVPLGVASKFGPMRLSLEYRIIPREGRFDFGYWDRSYDMERATFREDDGNVQVKTKESLLGRYGKQKGFYGMFGVDLGSLIVLKSEYQNLRGKIWNDEIDKFEDQQNRSFKASLALRKKVFRIKYATLFYQQRNVQNPFEFEFTERTVMGYGVGYEISAGITLNYIFRRTFRDLNGDGDVKDDGETINITTVETTFSL